ncbi:MAG: bifunctional diaminohydroxyphosphoribosylaminopyrimidine deaminase/5-amino-6-(5-phosphoribosylamino)uracil reductase RibD [Synergistaceae bacterium]|nr:bifunctional diaminohydroxyphosphoribosylaminopyrimidine deaminase/5-amino-6-(5-phosphoribosylamino)uracil reductase RibD [Synergistaceae bacterium]
MSAEFFPEVITIIHTEYMSRALSLARNGLRMTSPNPMVGCVIVKDGRIIGSGWHKKYGNPHAEIEAINDAHSRGENVRGSAVYVTLEPCSHYGKTPPCANRLVAEGVSHVIIAMRDPNPKVNGKGIDILREGGVKVTELDGEIQQSAKFLNRGFIFVHKYGRPFVSLKAAMSLDGRMNLANGSSKWITGVEARTEAHRMRAENDAVLVGVGTVLSDDPELTVRFVDGVNPLRVVLDSRLRTPPSAKVIGHDGKCLIITSEGADRQQKKALEDSGATVAEVSSRGGHVDIESALKYLAGRGILTLMVEGGPEVLSAFLRERLADYVRLFISSAKIFGEGSGLDVGLGFGDVGEAFTLTGIKTRILGGDIITEGRLSCSPDL